MNMTDHIYKGIFNSLQDAIVVTDLRGEILLTNLAWDELTQILNLSSEEVWPQKNYFQNSFILPSGHTKFSTYCTQQIEKLFLQTHGVAKMTVEAATKQETFRFQLTMSALPIEDKMYVVFSHRRIKNTAEIVTVEKLVKGKQRLMLPSEQCFEEFYLKQWASSMRKGSELGLLVAEFSTEIKGRTEVVLTDVFCRYARRSCDIAAKIQHNQLAIVFGRSTQKSSNKIAQDIYHEIAVLNLSKDNGLPIVVNIGTSSAVPTLVDTPDILKSAVNLALNKAKACNTNNVTSYCPSIILKSASISAKNPYDTQ